MDFGSSIVIQGVAYDSLNVDAAANYTSILSHQGLQSVTFDTLGIRNLNHYRFNSVLTAKGLMFNCRNIIYDPPPGAHRDSFAAATILEYFSSHAPQNGVIGLDTFLLPPAVAALSSGVVAYPVFSYNDLSSSDTIRYSYSIRRIDGGPNYARVCSYVLSADTVATKLSTIELEANDNSVNIPEAVWHRNDTLFWLRLVNVEDIFHLQLRHYSLQSGRLLAGQRFIDHDLFPAPQLDVSVGGQLASGGWNIIATEADGRNYLGLETRGYDIENATLKWKRQHRAPAGWHVYPGFNRAIPDRFGRQVLRIHSIERPLDDRGQQYERRVIVRGLDGETGDSLWLTTLQLDSFATVGHSIVPMDIAVRPEGKGFIVACGVLDSKLDPHRDLRYSYTALFFLDSVGCLTPGCRSPINVVEPKHNYQIILAPNPVAAGDVLQVMLPIEVEQVRVRVIDVLGQTMVAAASASVTAGKFMLSTEQLSAGHYYVTLWPAEGGGALVTKGFVVQ